MKKFWIVWCEQGKNPPTYKHESEELARAEAERLANTYGVGNVFHVLEHVDSCKRVTVEWASSRDENSGIPF